MRISTGLGVLVALGISSTASARIPIKPGPFTVMHGQAMENNGGFFKPKQPIRYKITYKKVGPKQYELSRKAQVTLVREYLTKNPEVLAAFGNAEWKISVTPRQTNGVRGWADDFKATRLGSKGTLKDSPWQGAEMVGVVAWRTSERPGSSRNGSNLIFNMLRIPEAKYLQK